MTHRNSLTVDRITSNRDSAGMHEYRIMRGDECLDLIYETDARAALCAYYQAEIERLQDKVAHATPTATLAAIGAALRADGKIMIGGAVTPATPYIDAAQALGYQARSHTVNGRRYLFVANDEKGLNLLKSAMDRETRDV